MDPVILTIVLSVATMSLAAAFFHKLTTQKRLLAESREATERFELVFNASPDAVVLTRCDDGRYVDVNDGFCSLTGYSRLEALGKTSRDLSLWISAADRDRVFHTIEQEGYCKNLVASFRLKNGSYIIGNLSAKQVFLKGVPHILSVTRDVTEQTRFQLQLAETAAHYRLLTEDVSDVVWKLDAQYRFTYISPADERLRGYPAQEVVGQHIFDLMTEEGMDLIKSKTAQRIAAEQQGEKTGQMIFEVQQRCRDGSLVWTEIFSTPERDKDGKICGFHGITRDISDRKRTELVLSETNRKLESLSITDGLTGIANRRHFDDLLTTEVSRHIRSGASLSLILLDIDHFKAYNDTYGHVRGDDCLRQISSILASHCSRAADLAARYGGEEFACILPETEGDGALLIAERIRSAILSLQIPHSSSGVAAYVTASIGVATQRCHEGMDSSELLTHVDALLYQAKHAGRNRVVQSTSGAPPSEGSASFVQLVWNDSFSCGNPLIDSQHKSLFHAANLLFEAIINAVPPSELSMQIEQLLQRAAQHFSDEQTILQKINFPGQEQHTEEHTQLTNRGYTLLDQLQHGQISVGAMFQFIAHELVVVHMLGADRTFFPYLSKL